MERKRLNMAIMLMIIFFVSNVSVKAQEKKNDIFSITPAFSFAWYPYAKFFKEESTNTGVDLNNFGMSAIMSLKLFDKVGAHLNLKIDDPAFKKLVDFAGYVTAYNFMIKFNYHAFSGSVTWTGNTPNPIPGDIYNFRNQWTNVSLMYRIDQFSFDSINNIKNEHLRYLLMIPVFALSEVGLLGSGRLTAIGLGYANFDMPLEYRVNSGRSLSNSGFGLIKGSVWGLSIYCDTLSWLMDPKYSGLSGSISFIPFLNYLWFNVDWFHGFQPIGSIGKGETDAQAIAWMSNSNNGAYINGNINQSIKYSVFNASLGF